MGARICRDSAAMQLAQRLEDEPSSVVRFSTRVAVFFWLRDAQRVSEEEESLAERNGGRVVEQSEMNPRDLRGKYQLRLGLGLHSEVDWLPAD